MANFETAQGDWITGPFCLVNGVYMPIILSHSETHTLTYDVNSHQGGGGNVLLTTEVYGTGIRLLDTYDDDAVSNGSTINLRVDLDVNAEGVISVIVKDPDDGSILSVIEQEVSAG